jgi:hypothetical protein
MRLFDRALPEPLLGDCVGGDKRKLSEIAQALVAEGLLEFDHTDADGEAWWKLSFLECGLRFRRCRLIHPVEGLRR